jgi:hypothetical protein
MAVRRHCHVVLDADASAWRETINEAPVEGALAGTVSMRPEEHLDEVKSRLHGHYVVFFDLPGGSEEPVLLGWRTGAARRLTLLSRYIVYLDS